MTEGGGGDGSRLGKAQVAAGGGPAFEEFADHLGVAGALRRQMGEAKLILNVADGGFGGAFDFEEGAEVGEGVEFDEAVGEAPGVAVLFEKKELLESEGLQEGEDLIGRSEVEVEGFAGAEAGGGGGTLEGEEGRGDFRFWIFDFRLTGGGRGAVKRTRRPESARRREPSGRSKKMLVSRTVPRCSPCKAARRARTASWESSWSLSSISRGME